MADADTTTRTMKRRGILAAAGAVVAGFAAKQTAQSVSAYTGGTDGTALIIGANDAFAPSGTPSKNAATFPTQLANAFSTVTANPVLVRGLGLVVTGSDGSSGVVGYCNGAGGSGVTGQSDKGFGVVGSVGNGGTGGYGIYGTTTNATSFGVYGVTGVSSSYGIHGHHSGGGVGVGGESETGTGVYGVTHASFNYGVLGTTDATNSTAIAGIANTNGSSAFSGGTTNPAAYAGVFQGNVVIQGQLVVSDPSYKSGALQHPDGSTRLVYCVESPESWIEDVGGGALTGGKATVTFDKDFAAVTHTDTYHVFLTGYDEHGESLVVSERRPDGFTVKERKGGTSNQAFSWRVMVKAKSGVKSERLGKFTMPNLPLPDPSKFKTPEIPPASKPLGKP